MPDELIIEGNVVSHKNAPFSHFHKAPCNFEKPWGLSHHFIGNAGQPGYVIWNILFRIDKGRKFIDNILTVKYEDSNFGNALMSGTPASGFYVNTAYMGPKVEQLSGTRNVKKQLPLPRSTLILINYPVLPYPALLTG
jgi:hypothetical protein